MWPRSRPRSARSPCWRASSAPPPEPRPLTPGRFLMPVGVQIPGNLGTLIRSAWAFGLDGVALGPGVVDPWNPKVVRASAGGIFHLPLVAAPAPAADRDPWDGVNLLCADAGGAPVGDSSAALDADWVLAVGGEVSGLPAAMLRRARAVAIPLAGDADSLNVAVAGSILMHLLTAATSRAHSARGHARRLRGVVREPVRGPVACRRVGGLSALALRRVRGAAAVVREPPDPGLRAGSRQVPAVWGRSQPCPPPD